MRGKTTAAPAAQRFSDGKLWRACSKCAELHDRGAGYSYCRPCATKYQRNVRRQHSSHSRRLKLIEAQLKRIEAMLELPPLELEP